MGWTFTSTKNKSKFIQILTKPQKYVDGTVAQCLSYSLGCHDKDVLWAAWEKENKCWIVCYLLECRDGWGFKDMSEDVFPYYYDCPDDLIDLVPTAEPNIFNLEWREARLKYFSDRK